MKRQENILKGKLAMHYRENMELKGKTILVTGACGLLGRELCCGIAEWGGQVIVADVREAEAKVFADELSLKYGIMTWAVLLDITSEDSVKNALEWLQKNDISPDGLVNSAYPRNKTYGTRFESITLESWRENVDIHLNGYFNVTQQISRLLMKKKQGCIVNFASIYGVVGPDFKIYDDTEMTMPAEYAAIKGGIVNFTRYLAAYLAPYEIRVNCVSPGGIENGQPDSFIKAYCERVPLKRMGKPQDIVGAVVFLLSDAAGYITGQNLLVDGGWTSV